MKGSVVAGPTMHPVTSTDMPEGNVSPIFATACPVPTVMPNWSERLNVAKNEAPLLPLAAR